MLTNHQMTQLGLREEEWTPNGRQLRDKKGIPVLERARHIHATLGLFRAARYLRKRGWSVEAAAWNLTREVRK